MKNRDNVAREIREGSQYITIPVAAIPLPPSTFKILCYMLSHAESYNPYTCQIMRDTGMTKPTIYRAIKQLLALNILSQEGEVLSDGTLFKQRVYRIQPVSKWLPPAPKSRKPRNVSKTTTEHTS